MQKERAEKRRKEAGETMTTQQIVTSVAAAARAPHAPLQLQELFRHPLGPDTSDKSVRVVRLFRRAHLLDATPHHQAHSGNLASRTVDGIVVSMCCLFCGLMHANSTMLAGRAMALRYSYHMSRMSV